ncbi:MAG: alpha-amylase family glycosyl hydrolase [Chloroflexota bacterium]
MFRRLNTSRHSFGQILIAALLLLTLAACDQGSPATPIPSPKATSAALPTATSVPASNATQPAAVPTAQLTGDGNVDPDKLFHDSRDPFYRTPGGAVTAGTAVTLRLKTAANDLTGAKIRIWNSRTETETVVQMSPTAPDIWEAKVATPADGAALWYRFIATDGSATAYYNDDRERDGGQGEGHLYESDTDYSLVAYDPNFKTPDWLKGGVVYQIFPDRFNNGDPTNDKPAGSFIYGAQTKGKQWGESPEGGNDFFGGDLKGVTAKLDYLKSLGVTAIYFNPIFASPSNHRYDTTDYKQIDPALGTLEDFKDLVAKAKERGMQIILDGVFNHSSSDSIYFDKFSRYPDNGAYESQQSPYSDWYSFKEWPKKYTSWFNIDTLPAYSESDALKNFLFNAPDSVVRQWTAEGIGGWRLDAAEQKSHSFWQNLRTVLKAQNPDAVIIGEFWQNSAPWLAGDQWDGTMSYRFRDAVLGWLANPIRPVETMAKKLASIIEDYPPQALATSMNLIDSHDTTRALTEAGNDKNMLRLLALMQFTWPGLPTVYYGDEAGLEGGKDPDDRRTYPWGSEDTSLIEYYTMLGRVRRETTALQTGDYINLGYNNELDVYSYARKDSKSTAVVALNRSAVDQELELPMKDVASDGTTFTDQMTNGTPYTVLGGTLKVNVGARWGVLLIAK